MRGPCLAFSLVVLLSCPAWGGPGRDVGTEGGGKGGAWVKKRGERSGSFSAALELRGGGIEGRPHVEIMVWLFPPQSLCSSVPPFLYIFLLLVLCHCPNHHFHFSLHLYIPLSILSPSPFLPSPDPVVHSPLSLSFPSLPLAMGVFLHLASDLNNPPFPLCA